MVNFESFQLPEPVLRALADMGFTEPSPIQETAIPVLLAGKDIIGQAQTGTGKTAAFGIPLIVAALAGRPGLVLAPTRELAQQVAGEINRIGVHAGIRALALYGGSSFGEQARALQRDGCDIVVATPGRLLDHFERGTLTPSSAKIVVLDEADEMLKMGFIDDVEKILNAVGSDRQTLLFSATMPEPIVHLAEKHLHEPEYVIADSPNDSIANANTEQFAVAVQHHEKMDVLIRLLAVERPTGTLVFRHTRESVDDLVQHLRRAGVTAEAIHGGMAQDRREDVVERLRDGNGVVLVATNVAARGLDVERISHVVNFDAPREAEAYVHRIGRTGRAGREGTSFLFVTPADRGRLRNIERALGNRLQWREVPSDEDVAKAVAEHAATWLRSRPDATEEHLRMVDASGVDPRRLAASLLASLAVREGLTAPPLQPRQQRRAAPERREARAGGVAVALSLNVGRDDQVRPGDIVGALTNEGGLIGADVGRIDILPRMSVVEVPEDAVEHLMRTMERSTIRGRRIQIRVADRWQFRTMPRA